MNPIDVVITKINTFRIYLYFFIAVCMFVPKSIFSQEPIPPKLIIKSFNVNNIEQKYDSVHKLKTTENNIRIIYEGIDLTFSGEVTYEFKLKEANQWQSTKETTLNLPALTPGSYTFMLRAKIPASKWSSTEIIEFDIQRPLYKQLWFIVFSLTLIIGSISYLIYTRNKNYLNKQRNELILQQKMNEMETQAKQAMMNPHFVFNALNSIQQYMQENDKQAVNRYLTKFSRLIRMNLDLATRRYITLEEEFEKLKLYLEIEQLRFGDKLTFDFSIEGNLEIDVINIPSMILQPFVENAIWHGIMPSVIIGHIKVTAGSVNNERTLRLQVIDNGIGINNSKNLSKARNHKSLGMQITIDRINLFSKQHNAEGLVLVTENTESSGTIVTIEMPLVYEKIYSN